MFSNEFVISMYVLLEKEVRHNRTLKTAKQPRNLFFVTHFSGKVCKLSTNHLQNQNKGGNRIGVYHWSAMLFFNADTQKYSSCVLVSSLPL